MQVFGLIEFIPFICASKLSKWGFNSTWTVNFPDVQAGFRKHRGTRDQFANIRWIIEKARELQKTIYFCFIDYAKAFNCVDHNKLCKILQEMGIPDHLTCLLRNLYAGQEAKVRTGHGTTDWSKWGNEYVKAVGSLLFSLGSWCTENFFVCVPSKSLFP